MRMLFKDIKFTKNEMIELDEIIEKENLKREETYYFMKKIYWQGEITRIAGDRIDAAKTFPPISRFTPGGERVKKLEQVLTVMTSFFDRNYKKN